MPPLIVRLARQQEERARAAEFISTHMFERYGSRPPPAGITWIAWLKEEIAGTLGFDCCDTYHTFEFQSFFQLDEALGLPVPACCETIAYSRWVTNRAKASLPLLYAVTSHCLTLGKRYGWAVMKPGVAALASGLGIKLMLCPSRIKTENLLAERSAYYLEGPRPEVYLVNLVQVKEAIGIKIVPMLESGGLILPE